MVISLLFQQPILFFAWVAAIIIAISVHEFSHAACAYWLGDPTAKYEGRLTLNPLAHLDPWGTLLLLFVGIGWGKPVPFNPYNLKNQRYGPAFVALAGPGSNLGLLVIFSLILRFIYPLTGLGTENALYIFLGLLVLLNAMLAIFNLIPVPPLDGSKLLMAVLPPRLDNVKIFLQKYGFFILIALIFLGQGLLIRLFGLVVYIIQAIFGIQLPFF